MPFLVAAGSWSALGEFLLALVSIGVLYSPLLFFFLILRWVSTRSMRKKSSELARSVGLAAVPGTSRLSGPIDGFTVDVTVGSGEDPRADIAVGDPDRIPANLSVGDENLLAGGGFILGKDVVTGDAKFDALFRCVGDEVDVVARLNGSVRTTLLRARHIMLRLRHGQVITSAYARPQQLGDGIRTALDLASMLAVRSQDLPRRLCENAATDLLPEAQLRNLMLLESHFRNSPFLEKACRALVGSPDARVRLHAARLLGKDGLPVLRQLAEDSNLEPEIRAGAIRALASIDGAPESAAILEAALASGFEAVRHAAIDGLGLLRHRPALPRLAALAWSVDPKTLCSLALALERIGDPAAEPALLTCLDSSSTAARVAAAHALGRIGTIASVQKLLDLTHGVLIDGELKEEARNAVSSIQERQPHAASGQLSLATPAPGAGELSLASGEGQLSIAEPEPRLPEGEASSQ